MFLGHYNHGDLIVKGDTQARVFVATEEYHYDYNRERLKAEFFLCDHDEDSDVHEEFDPALPRAVFQKEIIYDEDDVETDELFTWANWLSRDIAIGLLEKNNPIIRQDISFLSESEKQAGIMQAIPKLFNDTNFSDEQTFRGQLENFKKLMQIATNYHPDAADQEYSINGFKINIHFTKQHVLIMHPSGMAFFLKVKQIEKPVSGLKKLFSQGTTYDILIAVYRPAKEDKFTDIFDTDTNPEYIQQLQELWSDIITRAERGAYFYAKFCETVKVEDLLGYLELPVVKEKYNDYWDADKNHFWYSNYCFSMRLHGVRGYEGSLEIAREIKGEVFDLRTYLFQPNALENPTFVNLFYSSSEEENTTDPYSGPDGLRVFLYDWELFEEATGWYPKIGEALAAENEAYLEENDQFEIPDQLIIDSSFTFNEVFNIINSTIVPSDTYGWRFKIGNTKIAIQKTYIDEEDGQEMGDSIHIDDKSGLLIYIRASKPNEAPFLAIIFKENDKDGFVELNDGSPKRVIYFFNKIWKKIIDVYSHLKQYTKNSIRIALNNIDDEHIKIGSSKIGGKPDLPKNVTWFKNPKSNNPMAFIAQINFSETKMFDKEDRLPAKGILYLFYDTDKMPWGYDPKDATGKKVFYFDGDEAELERKELPDNTNEESIFLSASLNFENKIELPHYSSNLINLKFTGKESVKYYELEDEFEEINKLLGHSDNIQNGMELECELVTNGIYCGNPSAYENPKVKELEQNIINWNLLLQIDSNDDLGMMWGDSGRIYLWITDENLKNKNFEESWLILQCF